MPYPESSTGTSYHRPSSLSSSTISIVATWAMPASSALTLTWPWSAPNSTTYQSPSARASSTVTGKSSPWACFSAHSKLVLPLGSPSSSPPSATVKARPNASPSSMSPTQLRVHSVASLLTGFSAWVPSAAALPGAGWFIIEGCVLLVTCSGCLFSFPNKPETAWFLNKEEKELMIRPKARDAIYKGDDVFDWKYVRMVLTDPFVYLASGRLLLLIRRHLWLRYLPPHHYKGLRLRRHPSQLSNDPLYFRALFLLISPFPVMIGYVICVGTPKAVAGFSFSCLIITWVATNLIPDYKRSVGLAFFESIGNLSGVISSQLYPKKDGPRYVIGNQVLSLDLPICTFP
ncbi:hypothetical protein V1525DRAFT_434558 [Lipomyces kononenkoae]|uniref:Uncharacterized protein n=1 Tax=Lipomyces kononenkoae TaxID=34357 RepID=A0ACC3SVW5_LIPKO